MKLTTITAALILGAIEVLALDQRLLGCYENVDGKIKHNNNDSGQSSGLCLKVCYDLGLPLTVLAAGSECLCGTMLPAKKVADSKCDMPCAGYAPEKCGSLDGTYVNIYLSGIGKVEARPQSSSSSSTDASKPTSSGAPTDSASASPTASEEPKKSSGVSKAGAAAGAVVGVLAVAALIGGGILFWKRRRQQQVEEEYRRTLAVQSFGKKPEADHRLEPVMLQRRASDGSIADNEDYSRRILKVTNPDG